MNGKFTIERSVDYVEDDTPTVDDPQYYIEQARKPDNTILYAILGALAGLVVALLLK